MAHKTGGATLGGFAYEYDALGRITSRSHSLGAPSHPSPMSQSSQKTYAYDAAGRLVNEGSKTYRYGYLDKVLSVTDGKDKYTYTYHVDGQLASATYVTGGSQSLATETEDFLWDGLALIQRGGERFINEPHVGNAPKKLCFEGKPRAQRSARRARKGPRGNPVVSSKGTSYFNDMLGTTLGSKAKGRKYSAAELTAFGEDLTVNSSEAASRSPFPVPHSPFFTGKPYVAGLGHAFLFRNYRASLAKWQTSDPFGYPDGWNRLAYCGNNGVADVDLLGAHEVSIVPVEYLGWLIYDVWGECNHNFNNPAFVITLGRHHDKAYVLNKTILGEDGVMHTYTFSASLSKTDVNIQRISPWTKRINYAVEVKLIVTETWKEKILDEYNNVVGETTYQRTRQELVSKNGFHDINKSEE